ncbi:TPA: hypothetical protein DCY65_02530 [Candidatus Acetothermia bacterium]|nr:hypothetical protein [Candidatus Acetothermia bacterium]
MRGGLSPGSRVATGRLPVGRQAEFIAFMDQLLLTYRKGRLHVILDNVITHRSKKLRGEGPCLHRSVQRRGPAVPVDQGRGRDRALTV